MFIIEEAGIGRWKKASHASHRDRARISMLFSFRSAGREGGSMIGTDEFVSSGVQYGMIALLYNT